MKIESRPTINFGRSLKSSEEKEYCDVLKQGKEKIGNHGKSILILPSPSIPNDIGVGNLGNDKGFFDFAKKYWGINEIQLLPTGQFHEHKGKFAQYSGTSMDLGNHLINIKSYVSENDYNEIVNANKITDRINFANIVNPDSVQEKVLRKLFESGKYNNEIEAFKKENISRLEAKALYKALAKINGSVNFRKWNETDKNLFLLAPTDREKRIKEIYNLEPKEIDFYMFKQFLAEDSLKKAKNKLNSMDIKVNGDLICGFSNDEVWANPRAFIKNGSIGWGLPALNLETPEAEKLLREKVNFYAKHFDGIRIDASWTYINQPVNNEKHYYGDKILQIIDDEVKKVKGNNYNLDNIMHEFVASTENFNIYQGNYLRSYIRSRNKIYTSNGMSCDWGSNKGFLERGWDKEKFIIGATNHDSKRLHYKEKDAKALSEIFKIPVNEKNYIQAKLAEPLGAYNNMIFFADALDLKGNYQHNTDRTLDYTMQIPKDYQQKYFSTLESGKGFNPMDALEKNFKAKGLDKTEPELYKKIIKYKKILAGEENSLKNNIKKTTLKWIAGISCSTLIVAGLIKYYQSTKSKVK